MSSSSSPLLLHEALQKTDCPICLQPLDCLLRSSPHSHTVSPLSAIPTTGESSSASSSSLSSSEAVSAVHRTEPGSSASDAGEFRVTFAPGVYGSDDADPWDPRMAVAAPGSPHDGSSLQPGHRGVDGQAPPRHAGTDEAAAGVVVLGCGHMMHYLCAMQLCEYATHPSCPVCRLRLASSDDMILFRPRLRVPPPAAASMPEPALLSSLHEGGSRSGSHASRKRARLGTASRLDRVAVPVAEVLDEDSGGVQLVTSSTTPVPEGRVDDSGAEVSRAASVASGSGPVPDVRPLRHGGNVHRDHASDKAPRPTAVVDAEDTEADITIVGARQLPPSQAYAELLLRTTATWAARTDTLRARAEHLDNSQQQLQEDCDELERTLTVARRRREVLLSMPSSTNTQDVLQSMQRLGELRKLCLETRTSMTTTTAQLAEALRDHAELRRQTDKYTRKLARLESGDEGAGGDDLDALAMVAASHQRRRHAAAKPPQ